MKFLNLTLLVALFFAFACSSSSGNEKVSEDGVITIDSLKEEVMFIHDEVMPKIGALRKVRRDLLMQADSLMESNPDRAAMLTSAADDLAAASEGMMQWMRAFDLTYDTTEQAQRIYFEAEKVKIQQVKEDMLGSLAKGEELLESK